LGAHVFTYGSLIFPAMMEAVTGRVPSSGPARLSGFTRFSLLDRDYPGIVLRDAGVTLGRVYFDVFAAELERLDDFEGEEYRRERVRVVLSAGDVVDAFVYVLRPECSGLVNDAPWDPERFLESDLANTLLYAQRWADDDERGDP
jgi:gamma-glutamylcyclotransferase (GGCT)/AIG2-like uncharacterized protein YtfP